MVLGGSDEIQQNLDARYIGPVEAAWRLLDNSMHEEFPPVVRLALHLPGMHHVVFYPNTTCVDTEKKGYAIGRIYFDSPNSGERFYLRLLLMHVQGPKSYEHLRTVNNVKHPTFKSKCVALGLLEDDEEWIQCLQEAAIMNTGHQLRRLFSIILTECSSMQPYDLWKRFSLDICGDLHHKIRTLYGIPNPKLEIIKDYGLYLLNQILQPNGKSLSDFPPMPRPSGNWCTIIGNRLLSEHTELQLDAQREDVHGKICRLNVGQRAAFDVITSAILENKETTIFIKGGAGTGKTFTYNAVSLHIHSLGQSVITVASSRVVSLLLVGGRTAHSTFLIPLDVLDNSVCGFSKQSMQADLLRATKLVIWDEVPMQHKNYVEAFDRTLQDIYDTNKPFGGIVVVLGGDFRQVLPVVPKGVHEQIMAASLRRSTLRNNLTILSLDLNMRLNNAYPINVNFASFLMEIGSKPQEVVKLPSTIHRCRHLDELLSTIYPQLGVDGMATFEYLTERTILAAQNDDVNIINKNALGIFPGHACTYLAADKMSDIDGDDSAITN